jgi:hypothetical protein
MHITQKRLATRATFAFGERDLRFTVSDATGSHTLTVPYADIERGQDEIVERNIWLRNAGLFWVGLSLVIAVLADTTPRRLRGLGWLLIGIGCLVAYRLRTTTFTVLHSPKGRVLVIRNDPTHDQVLEEIDARRLRQRREWYAQVDPDNTPGREAAKFDWLRDEGVISDEEHAAAMARIQAHHRRTDAVRVASTRLH